MNQDYYKEEMMVKEAITNQKSDQEIGMPDIEAELKRVKQQAHKTKPIGQVWGKAAAALLIILSVSGLSWAFVHYNQVEITPVEQETTDNTADVIEEEQKQEETLAEQPITLAYDKATLEQIIEDLTHYYHLDKPVFENPEAARKFKMHVTLNPEGTLQEAIDLLNHFGSLHIELVENHLVVK